MKKKNEVKRKINKTLILWNGKKTDFSCTRSLFDRTIKICTTITHTHINIMWFGRYLSASKHKKTLLPRCSFFVPLHKNRAWNVETRKNTDFHRKRVVTRVCDGMLLIPFPLLVIFIVCGSNRRSEKTRRTKKTSRIHYEHFSRPKPNITKDTSQTHFLVT